MIYLDCIKNWLAAGTEINQHPLFSKIEICFFKHQTSNLMSRNPNCDPVTDRL